MILRLSISISIMLRIIRRPGVDRASLRALSLFLVSFRWSCRGQAPSPSVTGTVFDPTGRGHCRGHRHIGGEWARPATSTDASGRFGVRQRRSGAPAPDRGRRRLLASDAVDERDPFERSFGAATGTLSEDVVVRGRAAEFDPRRKPTRSCATCRKRSPSSRRKPWPSST